MERKGIKTKGIQSVERAFSILDTIKKFPDGLTLTELSNETNVTKSNLQKYLASFLSLDVLYFDETNKKYKFSLKLIDLGLNALRKKDIAALIDPYMNEIKEELSHASILALWSDEGPIIVKYLNSGKSINVEIEVGYRPPLLVSSVGKCFAAFLPKEIIENLYNQDLEEKNLKSEIIESQLEEVREKGFAYRETQFGDLPGNHTIACPIFDRTGEVAAVVGMIGFSHDLNLAIDGKEVKKLKKVAENVSKELAYLR